MNMYNGNAKETAVAAVGVRNQAPVLPVRQAPPVAPVDRLRSTMHGIGDGSVTPAAEFVTIGSDEGMFWEERPSPVLLLGLVLKHVSGILVMSLVLQSAALAALLALIALVHIGSRYGQLRSIRYRMSSQRLEITSGFFHQQI